TRRHTAAPDRGLRAAPMVAAGGRAVGQAVVADRPGTLIVSAPDWARSGWRGGEVYVRITTANGATARVDTTRLGNGAWVASLPVDGASVRRIAVLDDRGWVVCEARLPA
ncbi:MAG: hypothetical protein JWN46_2473, partial [Acidimicrobiales bacterium]|nr:hypothetical protein [Acidimicrobiales bacterium]